MGYLTAARSDDNLIKRGDGESARIGAGSPEKEGIVSIITISRGTFSGGKALAECLAEHLGYQCISREVVLDAAAEYGVAPESLLDAVAKPPSFWQRLSGERIAYLNYFRSALCERARKGNLVYHGYAGHLLLAGVRHVVRVRVIANMEYRIAAAMQQLNVGRSEAIGYIKKVDRERERWTRFLYDVDWHDPSLYDIVLNLEHTSLPTACNVIVGLVESADFQPTAASVKALEDLALSCRVWAALNRDPRTATAEVKVAADDGVVTVTGTARVEEAIEAIPLVAGEVEGVKDVTNKVAVGSFFMR